MIFLRIERYKSFKAFKTRLMVVTRLFGRGIDIERVNVVINYDMPTDSNEYLHKVGRAGRFGTKGLAISFVCSEENETVLKSIQSVFAVSIPKLPATLERSTYSTFLHSEILTATVYLTLFKRFSVLVGC